MLRGRHAGGGFWLIFRVNQTRVRLDWKQQLDMDGWRVNRSTIKSWTAYPTEPIKFHFEKSWTH